jgi:hemin uptake protein HemP
MDVPLNPQRRENTDDANRDGEPGALRLGPICQCQDLLRGDRLYIRHGEETYVLRLTKSGKLLLTK